MSQTNTPDVNGPSDIAPRQGSQEGVNITPSNPARQQGPYNQQLSSPQQQFGPRPLLRKNDSRSSIVTRPAGPVPPFVNQPQQQIGNIRQPSLPLQPRPSVPGPNFNTNLLSNPPPRYPSPQQPPARYGLYEHVPTIPGQEGNFRRAVNTVTESQVRFQRPPLQGSPGVVPGVRAPVLYPQKTLPPQNFPPSSGGVIEQNIRKTSTLDNFDGTVGHSAVNEQNGTGKIRNMDPAINDKQKYEDVRSSSSMGFHPDADKDIDTTSLNGKETSRDDTERPESKTGFLSRDHSSHSSMQKIDEDDDDAVVTPSRISHHSGSGSLRSGKTTPISNSNDNISQKLVDLGNKYPPAEYSEMRKSSPPVVPATETKYYPPHAYSSKPPNIGSTENITTKSPDITSQILESPKLYSREDTLRSQTPNMPRTEQARNDTLQMKNDKNSTQSQEFIRSKIMPSPQNEYKSSMGIRRPTSAKSQGDNDSGVDESTQGNDRSFNGEQSSPRKTPSKVSNSKLPSGKCKTPVKMLYSPKSPDPSNSVPASADKKKLPMNKIQVGAAPSPNIKTVKSKIGSLDNTSYRPGGGKIKVENRKIDFSKVQPKIAAKNDQYQPGGGDKKNDTDNDYSTYQMKYTEILEPNMVEIQQQKLQWNAKSKIGSLGNATYKPGGGDKKIESVKLDFKDKAKPKVGSKDNIKHVPGGGDVKSIEEEQAKEIETKKLDLHVQSKVGSLDNVKHKPGGGDIKIFDDKEYLRQKSGDQSVLSGSQEEEPVYQAPKIFKKRSNSAVRPPSSLNIASPSPRRRVRYLDLDGPQSLIAYSPESINYQRPKSACSNYSRKKSKLNVSFSITDRPPWRY